MLAKRVARTCGRKKTCSKLAGAVVNANMCYMNGVFRSRNSGTAGGFEETGYAESALFLVLQLITQALGTFGAG